VRKPGSPSVRLPDPLRCPKAEEMLQGKGMDQEIIAACAAEAMAAAVHRRPAGLGLVPKKSRSGPGGPGLTQAAGLKRSEEGTQS